MGTQFAVIGALGLILLAVILIALRTKRKEGAATQSSATAKETADALVRFNEGKNEAAKLTDDERLARLRDNSGGDEAA